MNYISQTPIRNKRVLLRLDYNVSLTPSHTIADDERIRQSLPTINELLKNENKLIIVTHLGRPQGRETKLSLQPVLEKLKEYLPNYNVTLVSDFINEKKLFSSQTPRDIFLLENIRFYKEEKENEESFAKKLASLADVYVNEAFSVDHRISASTVGVTSFLPSFAGLALEEELTYLNKMLSNPTRPFIAIAGGGKISTKLALLEKLLEKVDHLLVGGGIANTFLKAKGYEIGQSICEDELLDDAKNLLARFSSRLILPTDVVVVTNDKAVQTRNLNEIEPTDAIRDIGTHTISMFSDTILNAKTILWNGPVGLFEEKPFDRGTEELYEAITENTDALSLVGGGDTIAALSHHKDFHQTISHISTGGGAMLSYVQDGTLPGIEALEKNDKAERI